MEQSNSYSERSKNSRKYELKTTNFFLKQIKELSPEAARIIQLRMELARANPFRNKRVKGYSLFLFRIRFEDMHKEKRVVYLVDGSEVWALFIIDRDNDYKDVEKYLRKVGL